MQAEQLARHLEPAIFPFCCCDFSPAEAIPVAPANTATPAPKPDKTSRRSMMILLIQLKYPENDTVVADG